MIEKVYPYRFEIFFFTQVTILFGSLIITEDIFETIISPILFLVNLIAGILLISKKKFLMCFLILLLITSGVIFGTSLLDNMDQKVLKFLRMGTLFLFHVIVTLEIIKQVWSAKIVNRNVIVGLISGYISLGLIGFFICISIEMASPHSFRGLIDYINNPITLTESLLYYSYITLLTIGYGDIFPVTPLAQKASVLIGLMGQIYLVVITAIIVGKYINQLSITKND